MAAVASQIRADISGDVSGQIAVGEHIIQNNVDHGGFVYIAAPGETPTPRRRQLPVVLRGRQGPDLVGREQELRTAQDALASGIPVEFVGSPGIGKTAILKQLVHSALDGAAADGLVYHEARGEASEDTLYFLYLAFYETNVPFKPSEAQLRHAMSDIRALVVLDDVEADRTGVAQILDALPAANTVFAGARRSLWGGGCRSVQLRGLGRKAALELLTEELERELDRELTERERQVAAVIADAVDGHPLQLLRAAALVTKLGYGLAELADDLRRGSAPDELGRLLLESLNDEERLILEVLAALGGATLPADQLAELTGVREAGPVLESLMRLGLVQAHSPRYSTAGVVEPSARGDEPAPGDQATRAHMIRWLEARRDDPDAVVREIQAVLAVMGNAARDQEWGDLMRLGRAAEGALLLTGRWGAWREVVEHELLAARQLGDRKAEGWALHQLGSRALCLGDRAAALAGLTDALRIREELDDARGAEATQHNLDLLVDSGFGRIPGGEPPPAVGWTPGSARIPRVAFPFIVLLALLGLGATLLIPAWITDPIVRPALKLNVQPSSIDFGDQRIGTSSLPRTVIVSNDDSFDVTVSRVSFGGDASSSYQLARNACSVRLGPGRSCPVSVVFEPQREGLQEATLTVTDEALVEQTVSLRGVGTSRASIPALRLEPATVDFGDVVRSSSSTRPLTLRNDGGKQLPVGAISVTAADRAAFSVSRTNCPATLEPDARCVVDVTFSPFALGPHAAALSVSQADTGARKESILVGVGVGVGPPPTTRPPQSTSIDLRVPAAQILPYGTVYEAVATATVTPTATPTLAPVGELPRGLTFVDNRNGTGVFRGTILSSVGKVTVAVTAVSGSAEVVERFTLTIVPADVSLRWSQPLLQLTPGSVLEAEAIVTQVGGTRGDPSEALVKVDVLPCRVERGTVRVDASGRAVTTIQDLPGGVHTARASLVNSPNYRLVSSQPLTVLVVPDLLFVNGSLLSDLLPPADSGLCLPILGA